MKVMPRSPSLKPAFRQERADKGLLSWCVNVPLGLSPTGKRQQLYFASKTEARAECDLLKVRRSNFGNSLGAMTPARIAEASEAYKQLEPLGVGLLEAVRSYIADAQVRTGSVTLGEAFDRFAESKGSKSLKYQREIRLAKVTFEPLLKKMVCDVNHHDFEPLLSPLSAHVRNAKLRRLRSVFNLTIRRKWAKENPVSAIDFADIPRKEVEVFPVETVQRILEDALRNDLEFLPYRVFAFFCGIRPEGELERLDWSDIRLGERLVVLRSEITKTKRKRFVELSENAIEWLLEYQARGGRMDGLVAPLSPAIRHRKHYRNYKAAGIRKWIQQGARHCFCSYWLAMHKDVNKLVLQSGHTDADTMWTRYHAGVTESEAKKFWALRPPRFVTNVVAMTA
jgi:integrase